MIPLWGSPLTSCPPVMPLQEMEGAIGRKNINRIKVLTLPCSSKKKM